MDKAQVREIILEAIRNGDLSIYLSITSEPGPYGSGDGVKAYAHFRLFDEGISEGETDDYMSVAAL